MYGKMGSLTFVNVFVLFMYLFIFVAIIKCSEKCARRDWSDRVNYISIKHAP